MFPCCFCCFVFLSPVFLSLARQRHAILHTHTQYMRTCALIRPTGPNAGATLRNPEPAGKRNAPPPQGRHSSCGSFACGSHWLRSGSGGNVSHGTPRMVRLLNTALIATHTMQIRFSHRPAREGGHDAKLPTVVVFSTPSREGDPDRCRARCTADRNRSR